MKRLFLALAVISCITSTAFSASTDLEGVTFTAKPYITAVNNDTVAFDSSPITVRCKFGGIGTLSTAYASRPPYKQVYYFNQIPVKITSSSQSTSFPSISTGQSINDYGVIGTVKSIGANITTYILPTSDGAEMLFAYGEWLGHDVSRSSRDPWHVGVSQYSEYVYYSNNSYKTCDKIYWYRNCISYDLITQLDGDISICKLCNATLDSSYSYWDDHLSTGSQYPDTSNLEVRFDSEGTNYSDSNTFSRINNLLMDYDEYIRDTTAHQVSRTYYQFQSSGIDSGTITSSISNGTLGLNPNWTINSGSFTGAPAITGNPTIKKASIVDTNNSKSQFIVDFDSEIKDTVTSGSQTTTTINLSNPPIIIDWEEFPGIELPEMDFAAPVITVKRDPASLIDAVTQVTLTIKAEDPNGHNDPNPISINGGDFQPSPATYTVTENQAVSIVAKDTFGNVREYIANITNIDSEAPVITNIQQNNDQWTRDPIKLTVTAQDDVKLHKTAAYKYDFKKNGDANFVEGTWTSSRFYTVSEAGTVRVTVRDSLGKESTPELYEVRNIDKIAPTATYTLAPNADTMANATDGVLVSLNLIDTADPVTQESSGLSQTAVKWDTNSPWEAATEKIVHENGVYHVKVRDAVGNVSNEILVTVNNISTALPTIDSLVRDKNDVGYVTAPVTVTVTGSASSGSLDARPYSWDGGKTWTSINSLKVYKNGEYGVMIRDAAGNVSKEEYITILNIDSVKPTASIYMVKGAPEEDPSVGPEDWVWKLRIEADDIGSGVQAIDTLWDSQSYTSSPVIIEIAEAGIYGVTVTDKAGNQTYVEKVVTDEAIGGAGGSGSGEYVEVKVPGDGSAGDHFGAPIGDLVYGKTGAYNVKSGEYKNYLPGEEGIEVNVVVSSKSGRYITGTVNFNNMDYALKFNNTGETTARGRNSVPAKAFIPISGIANDVNNGRIRITIKEYGDSGLTKHVRDGVAQLYTSVQVTDPALMYTYDPVADKLTLSATSTVAGIKSVTYDIGSGAQAYTKPTSIGSASSVTMAAEDNVGNRVEMTKSARDLELNGGSGGSLPVEAGDGSINSQYQSSRSFESYIIGGSKSNTENLPSSSVFDSLLDGAA